MNPLPEFTLTPEFLAAAQAKVLLGQHIIISDMYMSCETMQALYALKLPKMQLERCIVGGMKITQKGGA